MKEITAEYLAEQGLSKTFPERFWAKVDKNGPVPSYCPELGSCWLWTGTRVNGGYGNINRGVGQNQTIRANRAAWVLHHGPIPDGLDVLHHCDNPPCVNPTHLFCGTAKINALDASSKGRMAAGERNGMVKLTEELVLEIRRLYASGGVSQYTLAKQVGCHQMTVSDLITRKTWRHI